MTVSRLPLKSGLLKCRCQWLLDLCTCTSLYVVLSVALSVRGSISDTLCKWLYLWHALYVVLSVARSVSSCIYGTLCTWFYLWHALCVALSLTRSVCGSIYGTLCMLHAL